MMWAEIKGAVLALTDGQGKPGGTAQLQLYRYMGRQGVSTRGDITTQLSLLQVGPLYR